MLQTSVGAGSLLRSKSRAWACEILRFVDSFIIIENNKGSVLPTGKDEG